MLDVVEDEEFRPRAEPSPQTVGHVGSLLAVYASLQPLVSEPRVEVILGRQGDEQLLHPAVRPLDPALEEDRLGLVRLPALGCRAVLALQRSQVELGHVPEYRGLPPVRQR